MAKAVKQPQRGAPIASQSSSPTVDKNGRSANINRGFFHGRIPAERSNSEALKGFYAAQGQSKEPPCSIFVVDDTGAVSAIENYRTMLKTGQFGITEYTNIVEMVDRIIKRAAGRQIGYLCITGHAFPGIQFMGQGDISLSKHSIGNTKSEGDVGTQLRRLTAHFSPEATVDLGGCNVGKGQEGEDILGDLASVWGVTVTGGTQKQSPIIPGFEGNTVSCTAPSVGEEATCQTSEAWEDSLWESYIDGWFGQTLRDLGGFNEGGLVADNDGCELLGFEPGCGDDLEVEPEKMELPAKYE